jgi:hypothetical protein
VERERTGYVLSGAGVADAPADKLQRALASGFQRVHVLAMLAALKPCG